MGTTLDQIEKKAWMKGWHDAMDWARRTGHADYLEDDPPCTHRLVVDTVARAASPVLEQAADPPPLTPEF